MHGENLKLANGLSGAPFFTLFFLDTAPLWSMH